MKTLTPKQQAKANGEKHYFTGKPCVRGHLSKRHVSDGSCLECRNITGANWRHEHPEETKAFYKNYHATHREEMREWRTRPEVVERERKNQREWRKKNPGRAAAHTRKWYVANKAKVREYASRPEVRERMKAASRRYSENHPDRRGEWAKENPEKRRAISGRRYAKKKLAMVPWANQEKIAAIYAEAERLTRETGIPHEVDHIYPIGGKTVMGLHHEDNLRVVTRFENRSKGNKMPEAA